MLTNKYLSSLLSLIFLSLINISAYGQTKVVVTIKPIHSISAFLLDGIDKPELLIDGKVSPHYFNLKPSQAKLIRNSSLLIWVGENIEATFVKTINTLDSDKHINFDVNAKKEKHINHDHHEYIHENQHYWLDPIKISQFATRLHNKFTYIYPDEIEKLNSNYTRLQSKLDRLNNQIKKMLNNKVIQTIDTHNALTHFNKRYGISQLASIQKNAHQKPSLKHILNLKEKINNSNNICLLVDKENPSKWEKVLNRLGNYPTKEIDITGMFLSKGKNLYFEMMQELATDISQCVTNNK